MRTRIVGTLLTLCLSALLSAQTSDQKLVSNVVAHSWITDTTAADAIRVHSKAMATVFETAQYVVNKFHRMDGSGWMSANKDDKADPSGWVLYDLISTSNGMDEIRLTYEESLVQERLLIIPTKKKWLLYRLGPGPDHVIHNDQIAMGDIVTK